MKTSEERKAWLKEYRQTERYQMRMRAYRRRWMKTEKGREGLRKMRQKVKAIIDEHRKECVDCGERDKALLQFHHLDPSKKKKQVVSFQSIKGALNEIAKCEVVCKICHKKRHEDMKPKKVQCPCCSSMVLPDRIVRV
jgi:hypothetical protein